MRILALITDAFGGHGGIAKFNRDFLTALGTHPDCAEIVAIPRFILKSSEPLPEKLTYVTEGINSKLKYIAIVLQNVKARNRFDLIICGHINLLPISYFISLWLRVPLILLIHGIDAWQPKKNMITRYLAKKIKTFISVSELTKERFLGWTGLDSMKGIVIPNSIDISRFAPGPKKEALLERYALKGKIVLMTVGRLVSRERYKGFDEVLELLPELARELPNIAYVIVGDGADRKRLENKAKAIGVINRTVFTGYVPESEKSDHYRLADVYVMPGRGEGFGIVFLEAMACGIPVVASKADGSREAVRNGEMGILVDPVKPDEIKAGILEAMKMPRGVIPAGLEYFSYNNFVQRLHQVVDSITGEI